MPRGTLALILLLCAADIPLAGPAQVPAPPAQDPVRCPALNEAPSITDDPNRHDLANRYLLLVERYCRGPVEIALTEILTFPIVNDPYPLYERDLGSGADRVLSDRGGINITPWYAPDGRTVAFTGQG